MCIVHIIYIMLNRVYTRIHYVEVNELVMLRRHSQISGLANRMAVNMKTVILMMIPIVVKLTHVAARCSTQLLQQYLVRQGLNDTNHAVLDTCAE